MLEQAIIDAKSLKEAAVKTAEEELLKKYSSQIKEAVENLLEQDEDPLTIGEDTSTETEDVVEELEMKALDGESNSDLEEGEMVELDLDALKEELEEAAKPDFLDLDKDGDKEEPMKKAAEEAEEMKEAVDVEDPEQALDADEIAEEIEITEENIAAAIEEILKVDYETVPRGDLGTTHPTKAQQEYAVDATLAKNESDDDEGDVYNPPLNVKELEENIKKLQEELDSVNLEKNKINEEYKNLKKVSMKAANKLEELNLSNAKLLYQNRILESDSLNERQKQRLVEKVSNAESINEAKIIFDTLNEELEARKSRAPKNLSEVTSKNSQLILKSNKPAESSVQEQVSNRMKKLAGLI
jgi:DNA repair exonuclease SbcCD ATPase subunit